MSSYLTKAGAQEILLRAAKETALRYELLETSSRSSRRLNLANVALSRVSRDIPHAETNGIFSLCQHDGGVLLGLTAKPYSFLGFQKQDLQDKCRFVEKSAQSLSLIDFQNKEGLPTTDLLSMASYVSAVTSVVCGNMSLDGVLRFPEEKTVCLPVEYRQKDTVSAQNTDITLFSAKCDEGFQFKDSGRDLHIDLRTLDLNFAIKIGSSDFLGLGVGEHCFTRANKKMVLRVDQMEDGNFYYTVQSGLFFLAKSAETGTPWVCGDKKIFVRLDTQKTHPISLKVPNSSISKNATNYSLGPQVEKMVNPNCQSVAFAPIFDYDTKKGTKKVSISGMMNYIQKCKTHGCRVFMGEWMFQSENGFSPIRKHFGFYEKSLLCFREIVLMNIADAEEFGVESQNVWVEALKRLVQKLDHLVGSENIACWNSVEYVYVDHSQVVSQLENKKFEMLEDIVAQARAQLTSHQMIMLDDALKAIEKNSHPNTPKFNQDQIVGFSEQEKSSLLELLAGNGIVKF